MIDLQRHLHELQDRLPQFTVYDHPADFPDGYVARLWLSLPAPEATNLVMQCPDVEPIREQLVRLGLVRLERSPGDDAKIMETWV